MSALKSKEVRTAFHLSLSNRFNSLDQLENDNNKTSRHDDSTSRKCGKTHARKSSAEEGHNTKRESLLYYEETGIEKGREISKHTYWTRAAKAKAQEDFTATYKEVMKGIRKGKRDNNENLAKQAEEAAGQGHLREQYMVTKKLSNKSQQTDKPMKDKNENPLTTTEEQLEIWVVHLESY